jgi:hypothetical protein
MQWRLLRTHRAFSSIHFLAPANLRETTFLSLPLWKKLGVSEERGEGSGFTLVIDFSID